MGSNVLRRYFFADQRTTDGRNFNVMFVNVACRPLPFILYTRHVLNFFKNFRRWTESKKRDSVSEIYTIVMAL